MIQLRGMPKQIGPLVIYSWGFDFKLPFGWTFVLCPRAGHAFISKDATPPDHPRVRGFFIWRR